MGASGASRASGDDDEDIGAVLGRLGADRRAVRERLDAMAAELEGSGDYRVLRRLAPRDRYHDGPPEGRPRRGVVVDVEVTGMDPASDRVVELGVLPFDFDDAGRVLRVHDGAAWLDDPGFPLPAHVTDLTGIRPEDVRGERIDDRAAAAAVGDAELVVAHNASFDRRFLERRLPGIFRDRAWACSVAEVDWHSRGVAHAALEQIGIALGFFFDGHRALDDCRALLHALALPGPTGVPALADLAAAAAAPTLRVWATGAPYGANAALRARGYRWSDGRAGGPRAWRGDVSPGAWDAERAWLAGIGCRVPAVRLLDARDRHSDRAERP